jgi:hypothetical protein
MVIKAFHNNGVASILPPANNLPSIARENDMGGLEDC